MDTEADFSCFLSCLSVVQLPSHKNDVPVLLQWTRQETKMDENQQLSKEQEWTFVFVVSDVIRLLHDGEHEKSNGSLSLHLGEASVRSAYPVSSWCQEHVESPCL